MVKKRLPAEPKSYVAFPNRLREWRETRKRSIEDVARAIGMTKSALARLETGQSELRLSRLKSLAAELGVAQADLLDETTRGEVPVIGEILADATVHLYAGPSNMTASCPRGVSPENTVALLVPGDGMRPMAGAGWLLFHAKTGRSIQGGDTGDMHVVELSDGSRLVRQLSIAQNGRWNLVSPNGAWTRDQKVVRTYPMYGLMRAEVALNSERPRPQHPVAEFPAIQTPVLTVHEPDTPPFLPRRSQR